MEPASIRLPSPLIFHHPTPFKSPKPQFQLNRTYTVSSHPPNPTQHKKQKATKRKMSWLTPMSVTSCLPSPTAQLESLPRTKKELILETKDINLKRSARTLDLSKQICAPSLNTTWTQPILQSDNSATTYHGKRFITQY